MLGMKLSRERLSAATTAIYERTAAELRRSRDPAACANLCRGSNAAFDGELDTVRAEGAAVACVPGCSYCCHLRVEVFAHEATALLDHLRTRAAPAEAATVVQRLRVNAERIDGMSVAEHRAAGIACAFLVEGSCSAYDVRPSACAAYHSLSRARCEESFRRPQDLGTARHSRPALLELQVFGSAVIEATQAGCAAAGVSGEQSELHQALRALLEDAAS
jgi:Fe-S-cluster containining protein